MQNAPYFIIGGAPKCGTGTLFDWLYNMPNLQGSTPKETHFAYDATHPLLAKNCNVHSHGKNAYFNYWRGENDILFEASTHYLFNDFSRSFFAQHFPNTHFVFVLREPAARVFSSYSYSKNNLAAFSKHISFPDFITLLKTNENEIYNYVNRQASAFTLKNDLKYSVYINYVSEWLKVFPKEQIHCVFFEDLMENPIQIIGQLMQKMSISDCFNPNLIALSNHRNDTLAIKNIQLHRFLIGINKAIKFMPGKTYLANWYKGLNKKTNQKSNEKEHIEDLKKYFTSENKKLANLLNQKLPNNWSC